MDGGLKESTWAVVSGSFLGVLSFLPPTPWVPLTHAQSPLWYFRVGDTGGDLWVWLHWPYGLSCSKSTFICCPNKKHCTAGWRLKPDIPFLRQGVYTLAFSWGLSLLAGSYHLAPLPKVTHLCTHYVFSKYPQFLFS